MKKMKTKLLTLVMAFSMILTMAMSMNLEVQAVSKDDTQTLTVKGVEDGTKVSVYKVIDLNIDDNGSILDPTYKWNASFSEWVEQNYRDYIANDDSVTDKFINLSDTEESSKSFWEELAAHVRTSQLDATETTDATGESVEFELGMGEYLILAEGGATLSYVPTAHAILPMNAPTGEMVLPETASINLKSTKITIDKQVETEDDKTVGIGDVVTYKVKADVPKYPANATDITYKVGDTMGAGLTYNGDVKVYTDEACTNEVLPEGNYKKSPAVAGFELSFEADFVKGRNGAPLYLKYTATVNKDAVSEKDPLKNKVTLTFNPDPYNNSVFTEIPDEEEVYTYNINFTKVDAAGKDLKGAEFELYDEDGTEKINLIEIYGGSYRVAEENEIGQATTTIKNDNGSTFNIKGLDTGTYVLKETKSPSGYVLPQDNKITITLVDKATADGSLDDATTAIADGVELYDDKVTLNGSTITFNVLNQTAGQLKLPVTGGEGILMFTLAGAVIMGLAVVVFVVSNKRCNRK